ncbi:mucin-5AC-like isoform X3 [Chelonus insularis]|uniref:mucin-5AC-like isoform X3 n=1 Tax=Chelonus insularis TaxID=460826 RepID=UPI0015897BFD|nr:mucin-5AC-like isoform X3 [Chelonus insularis]
MTRRSSWFVVILVLVVLFVRSDCLRKSITHNEGQNLSTTRSRGNARFSLKAEEGLGTTSEPLTTTSRSNRRSNNPSPHASATLSRRRTSAFTKTELTTEKVTTGFSLNPGKSRSKNTSSSSNGDLIRAASGDRRYLPDSSSRKKLDKVEEEVNFQTPHEFSKADRGQRGSSRSRNSRREFQRRIDSVDPINEAPSITKPRNERKIQVTLSSRDFEDSARYSSKRLSEEFSKPSESTRDKIPKSAARYFTERSIRRLDIDSSYSDQVNVGVPSASQPSILLPQKTQELKLGQTRVQLNNKNPDFTPRGSRRGISKFAESAAYVELVNNNEAKQLTTSKTLNSHSQKKERTPLKSLQASFSSKSRGRSSKLNDEISGNNDSDISRGFFLEKKILEKNERVNEKPKVKTDHQHFNTSERYRPRKHNGLSSLSKKSTKELVSSSINTVTTVPTTTAFTKEVVFLLSSKKPTEAPGNRRAATSILTIKTLPKEKDLDDTLDFRGRKEFKQASYTTSITFSNQNTENLLNDISSTNLSNNRRRGNKLFNKASITKTGKEIVGENDNYPPEFKAKLAQLDNSDKSNERSELPKINKDDEVTKIITRHLRSTDQADPLDIQSETDEIPDLILSESNISTLSEIFQGQKKRTPGTNFSTRSKQKLEEAKKLVKPELKSEEKVNPDNGSSTTLNSVKFNEESKSLQDPKRYDTFKLSSITPRTKVTISLPKIDKKIARTSKSIERGNVTIGETIRIRQNQKERITTTGTPDDVFVQSKTAYNSELTTVEKIKLETVTIRPLSSRNIDTTTVKMLSTTRRSRAWNAAYIDKNWQEPTPRSIDSHNTSRSVVSKPLTRSRGYTNRNRQISTTTMSNNETTQKSVTFKVTKRPRVWNSAYIDKNWQEPTKKSDVTSTQATVTSRNTYSSLTAEKTVQTSRRGNSRPRTATYRRHLEVSQPQNSLTGKKEVSSVAITPKYHALIKTENSTQQSIKKEPAVSLELLNKTNANETFNLIGISTSSRGNSGNSDSNIFNPARTTYLINSNASLLEQIKSTVAPLLSVLGAKAPAFAGVYRNVSSNETAAQRVTPSGSPPRFSARYRGVELFVRKPNDANSTGNASTTSFISSSDEASSPVSISNLGDSKEVTFYRALETVSINNEVNQATDEERQQQLNRVAQENTTATAQTTAGFQQATIQTTTETPFLTFDSRLTTLEIPLSTTQMLPSASEEIPLTSETPLSTTEIPPLTSEMTFSTPESTILSLNSIQSSFTAISPSSSSTQTTTSTLESTTIAPSTSEATTQSTIQSTTASMATFMQTTPFSTTPYMGRFGSSRMTPAPRLSSSSSTRMPLRDYHVYGIYPNKTIVRKRPEDNLIDARNVDSPYVIFGIYPDGKLVRKFPNGTVIPDPPTNPVEVVFSLSTSTTTNRPKPILQYNQANQGTNNQNTAIFNNRPTGSIFAQSSGQADGFRSQLDLGLSDNALSPDGDGPNQFGDPTLMPGIGTVSTQLSSTNMITNASPGGLRPPSGVTPSSINPQGGRIIQDIERDKASRTKEAGGQRSTVYIGQEKFINYWTNDTAQNDSRVVSVEINSVASAINEGLPGSSISPLDILPNNQVQGRVTAPPGFPWKDPLDQIFGITTESPIIRASVASNTLDEPSSSRSPITARPINRLLEVFTPLLNANQLARDTSITITNDAPTVSTTVGASMTTPTTTTSTTKSTTNSRPVTTTTMTNSAPTMMTTTLLPTPTIAASTTSTMSTSTTSLFTTIGIPKQTSFGTTFDDLAFLNTLLESDYRPNSISSTPKTLTEVERLLANKILSLALSQAGPTRSPKAIQPSNASPNSLDILPASFGHSSPPIIIDLLQSTSKKPVAATTTTEPFTWKPVTDVTSITSSKQTEISTKTTTSITSTTTTSTMTPSASQIIFDTFPTHPPTIKSSNLATILNTVTSSTTIPTISFTTTVTPKVITRKPVAVRPAPPPTTTQAPLGFGASLLQAIFGRNIFAPPTSTTQKPLKKVIQTTLRPVQTTPKPISTTAAREMYAASEQINHIDYSNSLVSGSKSTSPQATTKYSPEEDAKFLLELLEASERVKKGDKKESLVLSNDDEVFLRAILSGQAKVKIPKATTEDHASKNAVLLAELLKAQGIKPSTSSNHLREPLQGISITSTTTIGPQIISTSSKRPTTPRPRPTVKAQSSTYPPPLFSNFNFGLGRPENSEQNSEGGVRNQVLTAAIGATRLFSQFLGAAITGAAQQLQSFVRNSTRYVSEAVG